MSRQSALTLENPGKSASIRPPRKKAAESRATNGHATKTGHAPKNGSMAPAQTDILAPLVLKGTLEGHPQRLVDLKPAYSTALGAMYEHDSGDSGIPASTW
jgi:hypothetical protein